ncbi:MAG: DHH family phosphoesterase [Lachnospiraceae bacterium]|nr:DHH family phosphoesterase [Lachnospiraceae bacterium]
MAGKGTKIRLDGNVGRYLRWPLYLGGLLILLDIIVFFAYEPAFWITVIFTVIYALAAVILFVFRRDDIMAELVDFATEYNRAQHVMLKELDVPFGLLDMGGRLIWASNDLKDLLGTDRWMKEHITKIFENEELTVLPTVEEDYETHIAFGERNFRLKLRLVTPSEYGDAVLWHDDFGVTDAPDDSVIAMFLYDETENIALKTENFEEKMLVGLLYIDNYEEAFEGADEVRRSLVTAWIEREVNKYMKDYDAIVKRLEKDKYMFVFKQKYLSALEENRFSILDDVRNLNIYGLTMTISIGIGVLPDSYTKCYDLAYAAMDMALGRGGDQVVIKTPDKIKYFGGVSSTQEKSTRVKARVKAQALREYIETHEKIVIMGHTLADIDVLGAAVGIYRIAKTLEKRAYIVISDISTSIAPIIEGFRNNPDYEEDMIINGAKAKSLMDNDTLLVVVDVNRPTYTDTPELLEMTKAIVVLDHHRQMDERIDNAVISYVEPYASSASEMVAEILLYVSDNLKLRPIEADAMYGGIMIDSNNFLNKVGVRTFEAAAYLRRNGADITKIRKIFRTNLQEYQARADAISHAEIFMDHYALSEFDGTGLTSPTIIAAQAANSMLDIDGVKGAFIFTEFGGKIFVSARSIDELNVQILCEKLGGGGHMSAAGVQFEGISVQEAIQKVKDTIAEMVENKEIKQ